MKTLVTGSTGLIGSAVVRHLEASGSEAWRLVRGPHAPLVGTTARWDPDAGTIDHHALEDFDAVIHLAGENIAAGRWTQSRKVAIRQSRVRGTGLLAETLAGLNRPPTAFISASAVGYYGDRGSEVLTEQSPQGSGFLADVCREWEVATEPARERGIRVVNLRIGMVLSATGGALSRLLLPFRLGLGGRIGSGRQYMSWIGLDDLVRAVCFVAERAGIAGPVNAVAPEPVTNREFTRTLGSVLARPAVVPIPRFLLRAALGEMADSLLFASARVEPGVLLSSGFDFRSPTLLTALRQILDRQPFSS